MDFIVEKTEAFKVIGFAETFPFESAHRQIPEFWDEILLRYGNPMLLGKEPVTPIEKAMCHNCIGEFGVCIDNIGLPGRFRYMVAGKYQGGEVPEGMELFQVPAYHWAKFTSVGAIPAALQKLNDELWSRWLPENKEYERDGNITVEWYSHEGKPHQPDYQSAIWLPVRKKLQ